MPWPVKFKIIFCIAIVQISLFEWFEKINIFAIGCPKLNVPNTMIRDTRYDDDDDDDIFVNVDKIVFRFHNKLSDI